MPRTRSARVTLESAGRELELRSARSGSSGRRSGNTDSLGEAPQREFPGAKVVKTLNTVSCEVMVDAQRLAGGEHDMFMAGNDGGAKSRVSEMLKGWFGWKNVIDLGDISAARGTESYLPLWIRLWGSLQTANFNVKLVR